MIIAARVRESWDSHVIFSLKGLEYTFQYKRTYYTNIKRSSLAYHTSSFKFKLLLLTYKVLNGFAPTYLSELIQPYKNQRNLRSNNQYLLRVPKSRTTTFGDRAFSVCAPKLWNNLPTDVKSSPSIDIFKKKLKTYLFSN